MLRLFLAPNKKGRRSGPELTQIRRNAVTFLGNEGGSVTPHAAGTTANAGRTAPREGFAACRPKHRHEIMALVRAGKSWKHLVCQRQYGPIGTPSLSYLKVVYPQVRS